MLTRWGVARQEKVALKKVQLLLQLRLQEEVALHFHTSYRRSRYRLHLLQYGIKVPLDTWIQTASCCGKRKRQKRSIFPWQEHRQCSRPQGCWPFRFSVVLEVESTTCFEWSLRGCKGFFIRHVICEGIIEFHVLSKSMATISFLLTCSWGPFRKIQGAPERRKKKKRSWFPSLGTEVLVWVLGDVEFALNKSLIGQKWYKVQEKRSRIFLLLVENKCN